MEFSKLVDSLSTLFSNNKASKELFYVVRKNMYSYLGVKTLVTPKQTLQQVENLISKLGELKDVMSIYIALKQVAFGAMGIQSSNNLMHWHINFLAKRKIHYILLGYPVLAAFRDKNMPRLDTHFIDNSKYFFIIANSMHKFTDYLSFMNFIKTAQEKSEKVVVNFLDYEKPLVFWDFSNNKNKKNKRKDKTNQADGLSDKGESKQGDKTSIRDKTGKGKVSSYNISGYSRVGYNMPVKKVDTDKASIFAEKFLQKGGIIYVSDEYKEFVI